MYTSLGNRQPVISSYEMGLLAIGSALVFPYTLLPIINAPPQNQDSWIAILFMLAYTILINTPILFLTNKFRGLNICETTQTIMGKVVGNIFLIIIALFFTLMVASIMTIVGIFLNLYLLPETPTWAILLLMALPSAYAASKGAGTLARMSVIIVIFVILTIAVFFLFGIPKMHYFEFLPVLAESSLLDINFGGFITAARYSEIYVFFVFSYFLKKNHNITKSYLLSVLIFGLCFLTILVSTISVLGVSLAKIAWNPYFTFTRQVEGFEFLERLHSLNTLAWFPTAILKTALYCFMASYVFSNVFKTKSHKPFVLPVLAFGFILGLLPFIDKSSTLEILYSDMVYPFIVLPITFGLPLIMVIVYAIRHKKLKKIVKKTIKKKKKAVTSTA